MIGEESERSHRIAIRGHSIRADGGKKGREDKRIEERD
jgi:hypothetical protein